MDIPIIGERQATVDPAIALTIPSEPFPLNANQWYSGRSLYDDFAMHALNALIAGAGGNIDNYKPERLRQMTIKSYQIASWMMLSRKEFFMFLTEQAQKPQAQTSAPSSEASNASEK